MMLNELVKITKKRKRVGRGGGRGGTSGRGHDGQNVRSGGGKGHVFEGGQMPLTRRLPKRGFSNTRFATLVEIINLGQLNNLFSQGDVVSRESLIEKGLIKGKDRHLLKVLAKGNLEKKLILQVDACSKAAEEAIKGLGGEVHITQEK